MDSSVETTPVTTPAPEVTASAADYLNELKGQVDAASEKADRSAKLAERLERALSESDEDESKLTDDERDARFIKMFREASEADKRSGGSGLPLTTKLAEENAAMRRTLREMQAQMKELKERHERTQSPEFKYDNDAFSAIDTQVSKAIEDIYGEIDEHLFEAVSKDISKEIKRLKADSPATWEQIRRNPEYIKRMSQHFVEKKIPPKAREMLQAEKDRSTPMTMKELKQAFKEADGVKDLRARAELKSSIRQKMLEHSYKS